MVQHSQTLLTCCQDLSLLLHMDKVSHILLLAWHVLVKKLFPLMKCRQNAEVKHISIKYKVTSSEIFPNLNIPKILQQFEALYSNYTHSALSFALLMWTTQSISIRKFLSEPDTSSFTDLEKSSLGYTFRGSIP